MFPVGYISGLRDEGFVASYERIISMGEEFRTFLKGLESAAKFRVIVEDERLLGGIGKFMKVFPEYIKVLREEQFVRTCGRIADLSEASRIFLKRLESAVKFQVIVEDERLLGSIGKLMEFLPRYIKVLKEEQFVRTCRRIADLSDASRAFLIELGSVSKFKIIMEDEYLVENIDKLMRSADHIKRSKEAGFAEICRGIVTGSRED
jgi:deoxyribodipyrimidine photolyase-like uncharacterized protein